MIVLVHGGLSSAVQPHLYVEGHYERPGAARRLRLPAEPARLLRPGRGLHPAVAKDFGGGDLRDILAGVDAMEKAAPIDDKRLGVYGHSYGGFMTMWTVTHSQRFKAGVADWVSYYGENGINQWMVPFFGTTAYKDPAAYDKFSPIRYIQAARTPTFIYVGEGHGIRDAAHKAHLKARILGWFGKYLGQP
jgi:dipeptidyl aminopeptidase/acylaminoacyl peptidase